MKSLNTRLLTATGLIAISLLGMLGCSSADKTEARQRNYPDGTPKLAYHVLAADTHALHGTYTQYHPNGQVFLQAAYSYGALKTVSVVYDSAGNRLDTNLVTDYNGSYPLYTPEGDKLGRFPVVDGRLTGRATVYKPGTTQPLFALQYQDGLPLSAESELTARLDSLRAQLENGHTPGSLPQNAFGGQRAQQVQPLTAADRALGEKLVAHYEAEQFQQILATYDAEVTSSFSGALIKDYLQTLVQFYGPLQQARFVDGGRGRGPDGRLLAQVLYEAQFKYVKGGIVLTLAADGAPKLLDFSIQAEAYAPITQVRGVGDPVVSLVQNQNWAGLYDKLSKRAQDAFPKEKVLEVGAQIARLGTIVDYQLMQHGLALNESTLSMVAVYELEIDGQAIPFQLVFTRYNGVFQLESFETVTPEMLQQARR